MSNADSLEKAREALLQTLYNEGIKDQRVLRAIAQVPREDFITEELRDKAYENIALPIDKGQTISQPYIVGLMTQALELSGSERVLEVGTGSGYQCAVLAQLAREVFTIERVPLLSEAAKLLLLALGCRNVRFFIGDGSQGLPQEAPFDRIIVTAGAPRVPPDLFEQLTDDGILVAPVGKESHQSLYAYRRHGQRYEERFLCSCRFVRLLGEEGWPEA